MRNSWGLIRSHLVFGVTLIFFFIWHLKLKTLLSIDVKTPEKSYEMKKAENKGKKNYKHLNIGLIFI